MWHACALDPTSNTFVFATDYLYFWANLTYTGELHTLVRTLDLYIMNRTFSTPDSLPH